MTRAMRVLSARGCQESEFRGDRLSEDHGACFPKAADHSTVLGGLALLKDRGAVCGRHVGRVKNIFYSDGNAVQRSGGFSVLTQLIHCLGLRAGQIGIKKRPCPDRAVGIADALQTGVNQFYGRESAFLNSTRCLRCGQLKKFAHDPAEGLGNVFAEQRIRKPQRNAREQIQEHHRENNDREIRHDAFKNLYQLNLIAHNAL